MLITVQDDVPTAYNVVASTILDDDAFGGNLGGINDEPNAVAAIGAAGTLFSPGGDGIANITLISFTAFAAIAIGANGVAIQEAVNVSAPSVTGGATTWTFSSSSIANVATLTINTDGSYTFTTNAPLVHNVPGASEENLPLTFSFSVTDKDNDSSSGSLTVSVNDDTPVSTGVVVMASTVEGSAPLVGELATLVSFGADGKTGYFVETTDLSPSLTSLTSGGVALHYSTNGNVLEARVGGPAGALVFTFAVDQTTGQYTLTQSRGIDHSVSLGSVVGTNGDQFVAPEVTDTSGIAFAGRLTANGDVIIQITNAGSSQANWTVVAQEVGSGPPGIEYDLLNVTVPANSTLFVNIGPISNTPTNLKLELDGPGSPGGSTVVNSGAGLGYTAGTQIAIDELTLDLSSAVTIRDGDGDELALSGQLLVTITDGRPTITGPSVADVSEAGLPLVQFDFESLGISFGLDSVGASLAFATDGNGNPLHPAGITSGGAPLVYQLYTTPGGEKQLIAFKQGQTIAEPVFIVALTSPANPTGIFTLYQPLDHANANNTSIALNFSIVATDGDGTAVTQTFTVNVADDIPTASTNTTVQLDDDSLAPGATPIIATGTLGHDFGADGAGTVSWLSTGMTLGNNDLWYTYVSPTVLVITQLQNGVYVDVVRLTITDPALGTYSIQQLVPMRHPLQGSEDDVAFTVSYQVRDGDGDPAIGTITVNVNDDIPSVSANAMVNLDDDSLVAGAPPIIATGTLGHNFGGDGAGTVSWLSNGMTLGNNGLWYQYNSATELIITQDQGNGYIPVVRLTITNQATGAYSIEQLAPVRHPLQGIEDDVAFTVSYQVRDRDGDTDIGTITVNVNDSLPLAVKDDAVTIDEDSGIHSGNVMTNDFVGGDGATMTKVTFNAGATWRVIATEGDNLGNGVFGFTLPGVGTYTFKADGSWTFAPAQDFNGQTGFAYIITDSDGDESDPAVSIENTLTITVTPVNDAPVISIGATDSAADELTETNAGLTATGTLTVTDVDLTDIVTTSITFLEISGPDYGTNLTHGELNGYFKVMPGTVIDGTQTSGTLTWEFDSENQAFDFLAANTRLVLKYTITVTDSAGATATRIVEIGINGTNDAPVISGVDATLAYTENDPATVIDTSITIVDVDNATLQGATVWISIGFVSSEDVLGFVNQNGITGSYNTSTGVLQLTGSATVAQYKAALESVAYQNTSDNPSAANRTISYSVSDGTATSNVGTATVTVTPVNDAAIISGDVAGTVVEDAVPNTVSGNLNSTDVDNDDDAWQVASGNGTNGYGTFAVNAAGEWTYTLDNGNAAVNALNVGGTLFDTFTVATVDGTSQFVTVTIQGANDAAIISGDVAGTVVEDAVPNTVSGNLDSTDVDNDDDTFQPQVNVAGLYGTFSVDAAGVWTYTLDNANPAVDALNIGGTLLDTFTVTTVDGTTQLVTITIQGNTDNVAPVANEDGPYALLNSQILTMTTSVLANDVDSQPLTAELVSTTQNGVLVFNADGTFTYDPVNTFVGVDTFTYRAFDGALYSNPITVSIIVAAGSVSGQTI
ncbi:MAG: VCBS domain-containing protein, partial [Hoeflea sp.]|nr:VCBS domain-containing protein [Hoeflea sp.]